MPSELDELDCNGCGKNLCLVDAFDLQSNYFFCSEDCYEKWERDKKEERALEAKRISSEKGVTVIFEQGKQITNCCCTCKCDGCNCSFEDCPRCKCLGCMKVAK